MKKITALIPCYNEEASIASVIAEFPHQQLQRLGFVIEVVVIDNNSTDKTAQVARNAGAIVITEPQRGKGNALRTALYNISDDTDYVVMLDGNGSYHASEIMRLVELVDSNFTDVAVGSRLGGTIDRNAMRVSTRWGNWLFSLMARQVYRVNVTDCLSGYFAWRRNVVTELRQHLRSDDFAIAMEMIIKLSRMGWRVHSTPITFSPKIRARHRHVYEGVRILASFMRLLLWRPRIERVAFVSDTVWPYFTGGKEKRLDEVTRRLVRTGRQVDIYTLKWWDGPRSVINENGVHLHGIAKKRQIYKNDRRNVLPAITFSVACFKLLFRPYDVVDADSMPFFPLYSVRVVSWLRRKKMYATWHEVWGAHYWHSYMGAASGTVAALIEHVAMRLPDVIISNSNHTTKRLAIAGNKKPVITVPLGVDTDVILTTPAHELHSDIIFAGRLLDHKNVDVLIRAVGLVKRTKRDIQCLIVGNGPERPRLEELVRELHLQKNVTFFNFLEDHNELYSLMKSSKMLVQPSTREGFGLVVVEANACGIPVITTSHEQNAARDLIIEGENGLLARNDPKDMATQIRKILRGTQHMHPTKTLEERFGSYRWNSVAEEVEKALVGS